MNSRGVTHVALVVCYDAFEKVRDKFNQQMDWDKHLSKKDLRRAEREQLAFLKVRTPFKSHVNMCLKHGYIILLFY